MNFRALSMFLGAWVWLTVSESHAASLPDHAATGLVATFSDARHSVTTVVPTPDFVLKADESIDPQLAPEFTADWKGAIQIAKKAKYTFNIDGATDAKLKIDDKDVTGQPTELEAGLHTMGLTFARKPGPARLQMIWQADFFLAEPVPNSMFILSPSSLPASNTELIDRGRVLVEELNCIACHHTQSKLLMGRGAPDLSHIGSRAKSSWIYAWLADPKHFRSAALMPTVALKDDDRRDLAGYLSTLKDTNSKVKEPQPQSQKAETGKAIFESIGCVSCHGNTSVSLDGVGSKYPIGHLEAYLQDPLAFDPSGRMPGMLLVKEEVAALAQYLALSKNKDFEVPLPGGADLKHGQQLLQSAGCVNCHRAESGGKLLQPTTNEFGTLESLDLNKGCLADGPSGKAMKYGLTDGQRKDIAAFIESAKAHPFSSVSPAREFAVTVTKFRCTACHELDGAKPMDETDRIPPLTGAGSRLRREWIQTVLTQKQRSRPWYHKRMPEFGGKNMAKVTDQIISASGAGDADTLPVASKDQAMAGAKLTGTTAGGLGCITCHGFNGSKPAVGDDTRGPDLSTAAGRLRADHFRRWVLDPKRVMPTTPMPAFFADMPMAESREKIETLWNYVSLGSTMPPPAGWVDKNNYTIFVTEEPVVMRAHLPGVSGQPNIPRGIAVGLPGGVNYVFDAEKCQLAYAWSGPFLDMQPSWSGRGGQVVKVLGRRFFESTASLLRVGDGKGEGEAKFLGYDVSKKIPYFSFTIGGVPIHERIDFPAVAANQSGPLAIELVVNFDPTDKPIHLAAPADRWLLYSISDDAAKPALQHLDAGQTVKLPEKGGTLIIIIPEKSK